MAIKDKLKHFIIGFERLLFENHSCICCDREIIDGTKFSLCNKCTEKLTSIDITNDVKNLKMKMHFDKSISFYVYKETIATIIKKLKYSNKVYYSKYIAEMMTENLGYFENVDYITYVPITKNRLNSRGYNQAEEIAKEISNITKIPVVKVLLKTIDTKNQAELSQKDRMNNLKDCFKITSDHVDIKDKNIIIIDDVFTTGTTLNMCCKEIKKLKPKNITAMTLAKTIFENTKITK